MQPSSAADYKQLLTDVIKKQIVILGPDITLSKARNVKGITVADDGTVTNVEGSPQEVTQALIDQFVQLSGLIVKKTMEPLLSMSQAATPAPEATSGTTQSPASQEPLSIPVTDNMIPQPAIQAPVVETAPTTVAPQAVAQPPGTTQSPASPTQSPPVPQTSLATNVQPEPAPTGSNTQLEPAKNPLAA